MKIALVTGASRGIGRATDRLSREGFAAPALQLDVTDNTSGRAAADHVERQFGHFDVLVNNAGILPEATNPEPAEVVDAAMFRATFITNLFGAVAVLEAFLPLLRRARPAGP